MANAVEVKPREAEEAKGEDRVFVWPHLVRVEMIGMLLYLLLFSLMSIFINAPLRNLANPEVTPNPAKAPWYFLGLQELLLHMHPALAGVIVPGVVLVGLAAIPYFDTRREGTGIYFSGKTGFRIAVFSWVYTTVWELALILIDEFLVIPDMPQGAHGIGPALQTLLYKMVYGTADPAGANIEPSALITPVLTGIVVPTFFMILIPWLLVVLVKRFWKANMRGIMIALFSFFLASYVILILIGSAFRGHSMKLVPPGEVGHAVESLQ